MRVISKKKEDSRRVTCDCGAELEYNDNDIRIGEFGFGFIVCPECETEICLDDEGIELTIDNVKFPQHFASYENGVPIPDEQIKQWIRECLYILKDNDANHGVFTTIGSGDTVVIVHKYEDEYAVYVAQKYYMTSIPRN